MISNLLINSKDREYGTSSNFRVNIKNPPYMKNVKLLHCRIPHTWYNIDEYNNTILFNEGNGNLIATLTIGNYNINDLITELKTQLDAVGSDTYTITYNNSSMKLTISSTGTFSLLFASSSSEIWELLGFNNINRVSASSHIGDNVIDLIRIKQLFINIAELGTFGRNVDEDIKYTFIIPVNQNRSDIILFNDNDNFNQINNLSNRLVNKFNITIRDDRNRIVNLNGSDISILLHVC